MSEQDEKKESSKLEELYSIDKVRIRLDREKKLFSEKQITSSKDAVDVIGKEIVDYDREVFWVACFDTSGRPINVNEAAIGQIDACVISVREIHKVALLSNATSIMVFHNHPSGTLNISKGDLEFTKNLMRSCDFMQIQLLDHIIVAPAPENDGVNYNYRYRSLADEGILEQIKYEYEQQNDQQNVPKKTSVFEKEKTYLPKKLTTPKKPNSPTKPKKKRDRER